MVWNKTKLCRFHVATYDDLDSEHPGVYIALGAWMNSWCPLFWGAEQKLEQLCGKDLEAVCCDVDTVCLPSAWQSLLRDIKEWIADVDGKCILWLYGSAGPASPIIVFSNRIWSRIHQWVCYWIWNTNLTGCNVLHQKNHKELEKMWSCRPPSLKKDNGIWSDYGRLEKWRAVPCGHKSIVVTNYITLLSPNHLLTKSQDNFLSLYIWLRCVYFLCRSWSLYIGLKIL